MTKKEFHQLLQQHPAILLDGATGTNLMERGMPKGTCTELWVSQHPQVLQELQKEYVAAGSQILYASTFSANPLSMARYGLDRAETVKLNTRLVEISRYAAGDAALVAGDMTTVGRPLELEGPVTFTTVYDSYCIQAEALSRSGVDLLVAETMMGVEETIAAAQAVQNVCDLPLMCSFSVSSDGKCYFDGSLQEAVPLLTSLNVEALGVNCASGPEQLGALLAELAGLTETPILVKPNAGLPRIDPEGRAVYPLPPEEFARRMAELLPLGAKLVGGCCGTTPAHIQALAEILG